MYESIFLFISEALCVSVNTTHVIIESIMGVGSVNLTQVKLSKLSLFFCFFYGKKLDIASNI